MAKTQRRNMDEALSLGPKALDFIQGGNLAEKVEEQPRGKEPDKKKPAATKPKRPKRLPKRKREGDQPALAAAEVAPKPAPTAPAESGGTLVGQLLVPLTTRLQPKTAEMLRRACLEQKLAGKRPHSQQEIVELATQAWLRENGYL